MDFAIDEELWFGTGSDTEARRFAESEMAATLATVFAAKPFPVAARKVIKLTSSGQYDLDEVVAVLETDVTLSARLLRLVNSAAGGVRHECKSIRHGVSLAGRKQLSRIASAAAMLTLFGDAEEGRAVLQHCAVTGAIARHIGGHCGLDAEDLFTCGFMHDLGKLIMIESHGEPYLKLLAENPDSDTLHLVERERYGYDHAVLGAHLLSVWTIPEPVPQVVAWHHQPGRAYDENQTIAAMVQAVRMANQITHAIEQGAKEGEAVEAIAKDAAAQYLEVSEQQLAAMWPRLKSLYIKSAQVLGDGESDGPRSAKEASAKSPKPETSCVVCHEPASDYSCPSCGGDLCERHSVGPVCERCAQAGAAAVGRGRALAGKLAITAAAMAAIGAILWIVLV